MALDYTVLFTHLGKLVKHYNGAANDASGVSADLQEILDAFQDDDQDAAIEGLVSAFSSFQGSFVSLRSALAGFATRRLQDRATVLDELGVVETNIANVLSRLIVQMVDDTETVEESVLSIGAVTFTPAEVGATGKGTLLATPLLDGNTPPGSGLAAHRLYAGLESQLAKAETHRLRCTADSFSGGAQEGSESFLWTGGLANQQHGLEAEGSGQIGTIQGLARERILQNGDFESWAANAPSGWSVLAGTAGTHIVQEDEAADVYHGDSSLRLDGDGAAAEIVLAQNVSRTQVRARKMYALTARIKASAAVTNGDLAIGFEGTGYTPGDDEVIEVAAGSLPTSWTLVHAFVLMPSIIPTDFRLAIRWDDTPTDEKSLWIDDLLFGPVTYGAGIGLALVRGAAPFVLGDRFSFATSYSATGVFQKFFRQVYGVQLPTSDTPTIDDALAG